MSVHWLEIFNQGSLDKIKKESISPVFIVGCGRSGNTLVARILHESGNVCFPPENFTLWEVYSLFLKNIKKPWDELVNIVIECLINQKDFYRWEMVNITEVKKELLNSDDKTLGNIIDVWYKGYIKSKGYPNMRWGCKTPNITPYIGQFKKIFPNLKIIYVVRNPDDVVHSFQNASILEDVSKYMPAVIWKNYNDFVIKIISDVDLVLDYDCLIKNKNARDIIYSSLDFSKIIFTKFDNEDVVYTHLNNVNGEIRRYSICNDEIKSTNFISLRNKYNNKLKVLSDV